MSVDRSMNQSVLNLPSKGGTSAPESDDGGTRPGKWQVPLISQFNQLVNVEVVIEGRYNCIWKRQHWHSSGREIRSSETVPTRLALGSAKSGPYVGQRPRGVLPRKTPGATAAASEALMPRKTKETKEKMKEGEKRQPFASKCPGSSDSRELLRSGSV